MPRRLSSGEQRGGTQQQHSTWGGEASGDDDALDPASTEQPAPTALDQFRAFVHDRFRSELEAAAVLGGESGTDAQLGYGDFLRALRISGYGGSPDGLYREVSSHDRGSVPLRDLLDTCYRPHRGKRSSPSASRRKTASSADAGSSSAFAAGAPRRSCLRSSSRDRGGSGNPMPSSSNGSASSRSGSCDRGRLGSTIGDAVMLNNVLEDAFLLPPSGADGRSVTPPAPGHQQQQQQLQLQQHLQQQQLLQQQHLHQQRSLLQQAPPPHGDTMSMLTPPQGFTGPSPAAASRVSFADDRTAPPTPPPSFLPQANTTRSQAHHSSSQPPLNEQRRLTPPYPELRPPAMGGWPPLNAVSASPPALDTNPPGPASAGGGDTWRFRNELEQLRHEVSLIRRRQEDTGGLWESSKAETQEALRATAMKLKDDLARDLASLRGENGDLRASLTETMQAVAGDRQGRKAEAVEADRRARELQLWTEDRAQRLEALASAAHAQGMQNRSSLQEMERQHQDDLSREMTAFRAESSELRSSLSETMQAVQSDRQGRKAELAEQDCRTRDLQHWAEERCQRLDTSVQTAQSLAAQNRGTLQEVEKRQQTEVSEADRRTRELQLWMEDRAQRLDSSVQTVTTQAAQSREHLQDIEQRQQADLAAHRTRMEHNVSVRLEELERARGHSVEQLSARLEMLVDKLDTETRERIANDTIVAAGLVREEQGYREDADAALSARVLQLREALDALAKSCADRYEVLGESVLRSCKSVDEQKRARLEHEKKLPDALERFQAKLVKELSAEATQVTSSLETMKSEQTRLSQRIQKDQDDGRSRELQLLEATENLRREAQAEGARRDAAERALRQLLEEGTSDLSVAAAERKDIQQRVSRLIQRVGTLGDECNAVLVAEAVAEAAAQERGQREEALEQLAKKQDVDAQVQGFEAQLVRLSERCEEAYKNSHGVGAQLLDLNEQYEQVDEQSQKYSTRLAALSERCDEAHRVLEVEARRSHESSKKIEAQLEDVYTSLLGAAATQAKPEDAVEGLSKRLAALTERCEDAHRALESETHRREEDSRKLEVQVADLHTSFAGTVVIRGKQDIGDDLHKSSKAQSVTCSSASTTPRSGTTSSSSSSISLGTDGSRGELLMSQMAQDLTRTKEKLAAESGRWDEERCRQAKTVEQLQKEIADVRTKQGSDASVTGDAFERIAEELREAKKARSARTGEVESGLQSIRKELRRELSNAIPSAGAGKSQPLEANKSLGGTKPTLRLGDDDQVRGAAEKLGEQVAALAEKCEVERNHQTESITRISRKLETVEDSLAAEQRSRESSGKQLQEALELTRKDLAAEARDRRAQSSSLAQDVALLKLRRQHDGSSTDAGSLSLKASFSGAGGSGQDSTGGSTERLLSSRQTGPGQRSSMTGAPDVAAAEKGLQSGLTTLGDRVSNLEQRQRAAEERTVSMLDALMNGLYPSSP